jgi:transglutaminase-like putative cysteine protease
MTQTFEPDAGWLAFDPNPGKPGYGPPPGAWETS